MKIIERRIAVRNVDAIKIVVLGDVHCGSSGHDEAAFRSIVKEVQDNPNAYWIGMGDYIEAINMRDKRFSLDQLAEWMERKHLKDIVAAQRDRFLKIIEPIAPRCLALVCGNHESAITKWYERDVYGEILTAIKKAGGMDQRQALALGYSGWLVLRFPKGKDGRSRTKTLKIKCHHGYTGGRLAGSKALNMQRECWYTDAHIVLNGHSHNISVQPEVVERIDNNNNLIYETRYGCFTGSFMRTATVGATSYSEVKGYPPLPIGTIEIDVNLKGTIYTGGESGRPWFTPRPRVLA